MFLRIRLRYDYVTISYDTDSARGTAFPSGVYFNGRICTNCEYHRFSLDTSNSFYTSHSEASDEFAGKSWVRKSKNCPAPRV